MKKCTCNQQGNGGLSTILNQETAKQIMYRPFPVNRLNNNVGERPVRGIPYVRDSNFRNMDVNQVLSRDNSFFFGKGAQDTPRLGESLPSLPDGRTRDMMKGGAQSSLTGVQTGPPIAESTGGSLKEDKIVSKVAKQVAHLTGDERAKAIHHFAKMYGYGQDGGSFKSFMKKVGKAIKKGAKFVKDKKLISRGADIGAKIAGVLGQEELVAPLEGISKGAKMLGFGEGQYARAQEELKGTSPMPRGIDKQSFVPTHPMNFNRARLSKV